MDPQLEAAVVELALELPAYGQIRIANEALKRYALKVSPQGVRSIWLRHDLQTMNEASKSAASQIRSRRAGVDRSPAGRAGARQTGKKAHGEFESECPGYCGAQDTFYVGSLKGVGRVYQ